MKYKLNLHFTVDIEADILKSDLQSIIDRLAGELKKGGGVTLYSHNISVTKAPKHAVYKLAELTPEEVLPYVGGEPRTFTVGTVNFVVKMNSQRLYVFRDSLKCVACGIEGKKFVLERADHSVSPHFNLYAEEDGKPVLMTKDHIKPKFHGGENHHSNYQTMCSICNGIKGSVEMPLDVISKLRVVLRDNQGLTKKALSKLMTEEKVRLMGMGVAESPKARPKKKAKAKRVKTASVPVPGVLWTTTDLNIYDISGESDFWGYGVYSKVDPSCIHIACLKRKTPVELVSQEGESVLVRLHEEVEFRTWLRNLSQTRRD